VELVIYEKNADIGGTWLENRYPGKKIRQSVLVGELTYCRMCLRHSFACVYAQLRT
jgi:cation diffusion facilitator CzcD-associated flavoprotein CzcO